MTISWAGPRCNPWARSFSHEGMAHASITTFKLYVTELKKFDICICGEAAGMPVELWCGPLRRTHRVPPSLRLSKVGMQLSPSASMWSHVAPYLLYQESAPLGNQDSGVEGRREEGGGKRAEEEEEGDKGGGRRRKEEEMDGKEKQKPEVSSSPVREG